MLKRVRVFRNFLKVLITILLLDILILTVIGHYLKRELLIVDVDCDIYNFRLEIKFVTWAFILTFIVLLLIFYYLKRKFRGKSKKK